MDVDQEQPQDPQESPEESAPEAPEQESPEAPDQEPAAPEGEEPAAEDGKPKTSEPPKPDDGQHKRQGGYQRKIERLERQNQILLEQLQRGVGQPQSEPSKAQTPEQKAAEEFRRFVNQEVDRRESERQQREAVATFQKRTADARAKYDDWDDAISSLDIPTNSPLGQALLTSDTGPEIMYQLANNPAELARLSALPPWSQAREIGRLEAKASGAAPQTTPSPAKRPPAPPSNVGGSAAKSTRSLETLSISEYKKAYRSGRR